MGTLRQEQCGRVRITVVGDITAEQLLVVYTTKKAYNELTSPTLHKEELNNVTLDGMNYDVKLWGIVDDLWENYERLLPLLYNGTACFLVCFSIASEESYENVRKNWGPSLYHHKRNTPIILVGTHSDLRSDQNLQTISEKDGLKLKKIINAKEYMECSLVKNEGIEEIFHNAIRLSVRRQSRLKQLACVLI